LLQEKLLHLLARKAIIASKNSDYFANFFIYASSYQNKEYVEIKMILNSQVGTQRQFLEVFLTS